MIDESKRTSAPPKVIDGVTFHCYRTGIQQYLWRSEDGRCCAWSPTYRDTHAASVDGKGIPRRFMSLDNAMKAAVRTALDTERQVLVNSEDRGSLFRKNGKWHWRRGPVAVESYLRTFTLDDVRAHIAGIFRVPVEKVATKP